MPTTLRRIQVIVDPEVSEAIERARLVFGRDRSRASLLRELILLGASSLAAERERQRDGAERLGALLDSGAFDWEAYEKLKRRDTVGLSG